MCPNQYATGLTDGFYMCAIMVLGVSFIEQMVNHVRFRITYTVEKEEDIQEFVEEFVKESVQPVEEPVQPVEEPVEEPVQPVEDVKDQPTELEMDGSTHEKISRLRVKIGWMDEW
jgi:hypothetical protein